MIQVPSSTTQPILADWVEASCMFDARSSFSKAAVESVLDDAGIPNHSETVDDIWWEIQRRQTLVSRGYPFGITGSGVQRNMPWDQSLPYAFQLLVALSACYSGTRITG